MVRQWLPFCRFDCLVCLVVFTCVPMIALCLCEFGGVYRSVAVLVFCTLVVCGFVLTMGCLRFAVVFYVCFDLL